MRSVVIHHVEHGNVSGTCCNAIPVDLSLVWYSTSSVPASLTHRLQKIVMFSQAFRDIISMKMQSETGARDFFRWKIYVPHT